MHTKKRPKSNSIIVDATHTKARYNQKSPQEILQDRARKLRKAVYTMDESTKVKMPAKNTTNVLQDEIQYCQKLVAFVETESGIAQVPKILEPLNLL
ncbi:IS5/IS1182 family transposase, partial [Paenibacillus sp. GCM10012303]